MELPEAYLTICILVKAIKQQLRGVITHLYPILYENIFKLMESDITIFVDILHVKKLVRVGYKSVCYLEFIALKVFQHSHDTKQQILQQLFGLNCILSKGTDLQQRSICHCLPIFGGIRGPQFNKLGKALETVLISIVSVKN